MSKIESYQDLDTWKNAMDLAERVYQITASFPQDERFGLTAQIRRAVVSIPSNIAEGYGRGSRNDYIRFLRVARGSLYEVESQLLLAVRLGFITEPTYEQAVASIKAVIQPLAGLLRSLEP